MTDEDNSYDTPDTPHEINLAIREALKKTRALKITDMAGMNSIGVGLNEVAKITVEGTAGDFFGAFNGAATLRLIGDAGNYAGDTMSGGTIRIEGNAGYGAGSYLMGGVLNIEGNAGPCAGQGMYDGAIAIGGNAGPLAGMGMKGGMILIAGKCGKGAGHYMTGGVIYARSFKEPGKNAVELPLNKLDKSRLIEYLEVDELEVDEYKKLVPAEEKIEPEGYPVILSSPENGYLEKLVFSPAYRFYSGEEQGRMENIELRVKVGTGLRALKIPYPIMLYDMGNTSPTAMAEAKELKIPVIGLHAHEETEEEEESPTPGILRIEPDRMNVNIESLSSAKGIELIPGTGAGFEKGGVLISPTPERPLDINTENDLKGFIELLREVVAESCPIFVTVAGENIYDTVMSLASAGVDAIILRSALPSAALTTAMEALDDADKRDSVSLFVLGDFREPETAVKLFCLGAAGVVLTVPDVGPKLEEEREAFSLHTLVEGIRVLTAYAGHTSISELSREELRALDYTTAAVTGAKLVGYDQKLPIWRQ